MRRKVLTWFRALRVTQWTKNAVVMAAWFFAFADSAQSAKARSVESFLLALGMAGSFCLVSSAFYLLNDVSDIKSDRRHPLKRLRPVASGAVHAITAVRASLVLFAAGVSFPAWVVFNWPERTLAFGTILFYSILQCLYSGILKHIPYVDVAIIAFGFVVRAVAGAAVIDARISPWLLVCTFMLALFLALAKRREELKVDKNLAAAARAKRGVRRALTGYHPLALDVLLAMSALATLALYMSYTLCEDTLRRFNTGHLVWTSLWVALGLARYLFLVYSPSGGGTGRPERVLLTDWILWLILVGYGVTAVLAVKWEIMGGIL